MKKTYCVVCSKYKKFENPEISYTLEKQQFFLLFAAGVALEMKRYLKKKNHLKY